MSGGVLVVGGGVAGAATALAVRDRGAEVLLVEREAPGARATGASAGMLAPQYEAEWPEPVFRLGLRGRDLHPAFAGRLAELAGVELEVRTPGMLVPAFDRHEARRLEDRAGWQREDGLRAEWLGPDAGRSRQPGAGRGAVGFLWLPDEAVVDAQRLARALPAALEAAGVRTVRAAAAALVADGGRIRGVRLRDGRELEAGRVVLAAGAWSGSLDGLPRPLPVRPVRGQMLRYPPGAAELSRLLANLGGRYLVPRPDGTLLAGSTMEAAGFDASATETGVRAVRRAAERMLPALEGTEPVDRWAGLRPGTPDEMPILGPDPDVGGLVYATGFGRNGILLAPAAARIAAALALGEEPEADWRPFRPDRFGGRDGRTEGPAPPGEAGRPGDDGEAPTGGAPP